MKKELVAAALLLLLFCGTLLNIHINDTLMTELDDMVTLAYYRAQNGDWGGARDELKAACDRWLSVDGYTHIFIRHSEIGGTTEAFCSMLSSVCAEDEGDLEGSYNMLHAQLMSLIGMEHISLGSIF